MITPYIDKKEILVRIKKFLIEKKGYHEKDITENYLLDDGKITALIDLLISIDGMNKILILCETPDQHISLSVRIATLMSKLLKPHPRIAVVTNWRETEVIDVADEKSIGFSLERIPPREEIKGMKNPEFNFTLEREERLKKVFSGLYSLKCQKCGLKKFP